MKLTELIYPSECIAYPKNKNLDISKITTDIYDVDEECMFVALRHINFSIENNICFASTKSPKIIVCDETLTIDESNQNVIRVNDIRKTTAMLFSRFYKIDYHNTKFIGITGTNGKTSTATMLEHILISVGKKVGFIGTGSIKINGKRISENTYSMTTPDPEVLYKYIKEMQDYCCEYIIMEVSSHALFYKKTAPIKFEIGIFTNLSSEHLDFHKGMDEYYETKLQLFESCNQAIFNMDNEYSSRAYHSVKCTRHSIGVLHSADVMARDVCLGGLENSEYIYRESNLIFKVKLKLGGAFNVYNSMLALKASIILGVLPCMAKKAIGALEFIEGRLEIIKKDVTVIVDYAHTSDALRNILKTVKCALKSRQRLVTIFGCGGNRDTLKRPQMAKIAEEYSDFVVVTSDNSRDEDRSKIFKDILKGFSDTKKRKVITSRERAIRKTILESAVGDVVLIVGKGHERYNIDKTGYHYFSERDIVTAALEDRERIAEDEDRIKQTVADS